MSKQYYIVSLRHTSKGDTALTLWGPNNAGYCYDKSRAGVYSEEQISHHNTDKENIAVDKEKADALFLPATDFNDKFVALPNNTTVRAILGLPTAPMKPAKYKTCKMIFHAPNASYEQH